MDWNTIYEAVSPYLGTTTITAGIVAVLTFIFKFRSLMKQAKAALSSTTIAAEKALKKAIPKNLYLQVETLTKKELAVIVEEIKNACGREVFGADQSEHRTHAGRRKGPNELESYARQHERGNR